MLKIITNKNFILFFTIFILLLLSKSSVVGQINDIERERLARWHINYASYLIDVGKYLEALENYETAFEISHHRSIKVEALLAKAALLSTFLDAPEEALKVYQQIEKEYPEKAEIAIYRQGLLLFDIGRTKEAKKVLEKYLKLYPEGSFRFQAEALLERLKILPPPKPQVVIKRPFVRVRLGKGLREVIISGQPVCNENLGCRNKFVIKALPNYKILVGNSVFRSEVCFTSSKPILVSQKKKNKRVRGKVCIKNYRGKLLVLNILDIEKYLLGVVPSESIPSWPLETLKAQAVAARTYAYYQILHRKNRLYDLVDDEGDQAYGGVDKEHPRTTKAVIATEGEVLVYKNRPILAMYTANSGGYTADPKAVFDLYKPYLKAKPDPESLKGKMAKWRREYSISEVEKRLAKIGITIKGLYDIKPTQIGPSGRIIKVRLISKSGQYVFRTRTTLKRALRLPDILLSIKRRGNKFIFEGRGFGHGVGYSQWGAAFLGKFENYKKILEFYYPGTEVKKLW